MQNLLCPDNLRLTHDINKQNFVIGCGPGEHKKMLNPYLYEEKEDNKTFVVLCDECPGGEYSELDHDEAERIVNMCRAKGTKHISILKAVKKLTGVGISCFI